MFYNNKLTLCIVFCVMGLFILSCEDDVDEEEISPENPPPGMLWIDGGDFTMGNVGYRHF